MPRKVASRDCSAARAAALVPSGLTTSASSSVITIAHVPASSRWFMSAAIARVVARKPASVPPPEVFSSAVAARKASMSEVRGVRTRATLL
jgi:hypothetical protein